MRVDSAFTLNSMASGRDGHSKIRLLSVDDDELNQIFITEILSDICDVRVAMDGEEALAIVDQFKPDVILLDVIMPGMSGYEVCRALRAMPQHARVKIIFTSAKIRPKEREEGYTAGGNDYISKPVSYDELVGKVNIFTQLQRIEDECRAHKRESERLRAHVQLLERINYARRDHIVLKDQATVKEVLIACVRASEVEAGLFLMVHEALGVQFAAFAQSQLGGVAELNVQGINADKGLVADALDDRGPAVYHNLELPACALGLPDVFGVVESVLSVSFPISRQERGGVLLINKRYEGSFSEEDGALATLLVTEFEHSFCDKT